MEKDYCGFNFVKIKKDDLIYGLRNANERRILLIAQAFREGFSLSEIHEFSRIDPWFLDQILQIVEFEAKIDMDILNDEVLLRDAKAMGFSDKMIAYLINQKDNLELSQNDIYFARDKLKISLEYNEVDTCAGEFKALTPYLYSTTKMKI